MKKNQAKQNQPELQNLLQRMEDSGFYTKNEMSAIRGSLTDNVIEMFPSKKAI